MSFISPANIDRHLVPKSCVEWNGMIMIMIMIMIMTMTTTMVSYHHVEAPRAVRGSVGVSSMDMWCPYGIGREIWDS